MLKIGDSVGAIYKYSKDGKEYCFLREDKINKIVELKSGKKYHTKAKFHPLDAEEVDGNTKIQEKAAGFILTGEVFGLNDITRLRAEKWVEWANENLDMAVSVLSNKESRGNGCSRPIERLAKAIFEKDKGTVLPVSMTICEEYGMQGLCGTNCPSYGCKGECENGC